MSGWRGIFAGVLALVALEAVVSTTGAAERTAGLLTTIAGLTSRVLDPMIPAIPDLRGSGSRPATHSAALPTAPAPANAKPKPPRPVVVNA